MEKQLILSLVALFTMFVAFLLIVVGVSTRGWSTLNGINVGVGLLDGLAPYLSSSDLAKGRAIYALCVLATLCSSAALPMTFAYVVMRVTGKINSEAYGVLRTAIAGVCTAGGLLGVGGSVFHAVNQGLGVFFATAAVSSGFYLLPGYSFYLTLIGSIALSCTGKLVHKTKPDNQVTGGAIQVATNGGSPTTTVLMDQVTKRT